MTPMLDTQTEAAVTGTKALSREVARGPQAGEAEDRLTAFVSELRRMTPAERIRASRYTMNRWEYWAYAARYPDEVPLINGELERIALSLA